MILKKIKWSPGVGLPTPRGNIQVYYNNIQRSLKPLGQSKPNFIGSIYGKGEPNVFINNPGHMTKMAAMPIYGKKKKKKKKKKKLQNTSKHWTDFNETWHVASGTGVLQCVHKSCFMTKTFVLFSIFYG